MQLSAHFHLDELVASQTAARRAIDNTPDDEVVTNLRRLAEVMESVRKALGNNAIIVTSGYRCVALNSAIGGSKTSAHCHGCAIDFISPRFGDPYDICLVIQAATGIKYDKLIHEYGRWVHLAIPRAGESARWQALTKCSGQPYITGIHRCPGGKK